jgi:hypothetical protein
MAAPKLRDVQEKIRKIPELRFLAEMIGETDLDTVTAGVNHKGVLLVNPRLAADVSTDRLCMLVKNEFRVAQEIRQGTSIHLPH